MRKHLNSRINFCLAIIAISLLCVSCRYIDDKFLLDEQSIINVDSVQNLGYLSQSENVNNIETMDTLTAIFDEKGNVINIEEEIILKDNKKETIENKNNSTKNSSEIVLNNTVSINNTTNDNPNQKTVNKSNSKKTITKKTIIKKEIIENNQERDYRLQKSNHAIPDL